MRIAALAAALSLLVALPLQAAQPTRIDDQAGRQLGRQVAGVVLGALQVPAPAS